MIDEPFMMTISGRKIYPKNLRASTFTAFDIAWSLARLPRFCGHTHTFYSVAQHCVEMTRMALKNGEDKLDCLYILLHDAHEMVMGDIPSPVKMSFPEIEKFCDEVQEEILFCLGLDPMTDDQKKLIKEYDLAALYDEAARYTTNYHEWLDEPTHVFPGEKSTLAWTPEEAFKEFLMMYEWLSASIDVWTKE